MSELIKLFYLYEQKSIKSLKSLYYVKKNIIKRLHDANSQFLASSYYRNVLYYLMN